jgi:hypothetical protein
MGRGNGGMAMSLTQCVVGRVTGACVMVIGVFMLINDFADVDDFIKRKILGVLLTVQYTIWVAVSMRGNPPFSDHRLNAQKVSIRSRFG